jgi:hypothetical protein
MSTGQLLERERLETFDEAILEFQQTMEEAARSGALDPERLELFSATVREAAGRANDQVLPQIEPDLANEISRRLISILTLDPTTRNALDAADQYLIDLEATGQVPAHRRQAEASFTAVPRKSALAIRSLPLCWDRLSERYTTLGGVERVREVLGLMRDETIVELHDAHRIGGHAVVADHALADPEVAQTLNPAYAEVPLRRMPTTLCPDRRSAFEALTGLRVIQDRVRCVDRMLSTNLSALRGLPVLLYPSPDIGVGRAGRAHLVFHSASIDAVTTQSHKTPVSPNPGRTPECSGAPSCLRSASALTRSSCRPGARHRCRGIASTLMSHDLATSIPRSD